MAQVKINDGILEGEVLDSVLDFKYYSFRGIPYAQPPIGDLRFKSPQPPKPWKGIRNAKEHGPVCYQADYIFRDAFIGGSEDCLYLNVYTKDIYAKEPLPVMFWIHGGGYMVGSGNDDIYGPDFLLDKDVVLVTFNYRLDIFGFLCLDTEDVPGNAGMKDQVAALRWVKNNISYFGGDPNNVTIFGESAGSASTCFHLISPMSKGLFKRAILQSGTCNGDWNKTYNARDRAVLLARKLGKETENGNELYEFFKTIPTDKLYGQGAMLTLAESEHPLLNIPWTIVDEKEFGNNERFFYGNVLDSFRNSTLSGVDVLIGYTKHEGSLLGFMNKDKIIEKSNYYFDMFVPVSMAWKLPIQQQLDLGREMRNYYYGNAVISNENLEPLTRFIATYFMIYPVKEFLKTYFSSQSKMYFYKFNFHSERNIFGERFGFNKILPEDKIISHVDDLMYLFHSNYYGLPIDKSSEGYKMISTMTTLWTNFSKYGNPTPDNQLGFKWVPYSLENEEYLDIDEDLTMKQSPDKEEVEFWEALLRKYDQ